MEIQNDVLNSPTVWIPTTLEEFSSLKEQMQQCTYVAGGTLLQLRWQAAQTTPTQLINLEEILSLKQYTIDEQFVTIGALTKLNTLRFDPDLSEALPVVAVAVKSIAAPAVRNRATIGGNVMGGEGDLIPLLLAMQAELTFLQDGDFKTMTMEEWLAIRHSIDDLLLDITIPTYNPAQTTTFYRKIGRRETFTAAILTVAGQVRYVDGVMEQVTLSVGGASNQPMRFTKAEQYLQNKTAQHIDWKILYRSIIEQYPAATDIFVTSNYKKKVAANLIISELQKIIHHQFEQEEAVVHEV
ncbi:MAG: FAD binding domain-containing protein [Solibacillus sp.]